MRNNAGAVAPFITSSAGARSMARANSRWLTAALLAACLHVQAGDVRPSAPETGDGFIRNSEARVRLDVTRAQRLSWSITGERWDSADGVWVKTFTGSLAGNFLGIDAKDRREQYHCFYPFQTVQEPSLPDLSVDKIHTSIEDGSACLTFRVAKKDLWCDCRIKILRDTSIILFEPAGQSPNIGPHWTLYLSSDKPMLRLVADTPGNALAPTETEARNHEGRSFVTSSQRYCAVYNPAAEQFFVFVWPGFDKPERRSAQWVRDKGVGAVYLDAPFALWAGRMACEKDSRSMAHLAEGARSQTMDILAPRTF